MALREGDRSAFPRARERTRSDFDFALRKDRSSVLKHPGRVCAEPLGGPVAIVPCATLGSGSRLGFSLQNSRLARLRRALAKHRGRRLLARWPCRQADAGEDQHEADDVEGHELLAQQRGGKERAEIILFDLP